MLRQTQIAIPTLVRVKEGALDRLGIYLGRSGHRAVAVLISDRKNRRAATIHRLRSGPNTSRVTLTSNAVSTSN